MHARVQAQELDAKAKVAENNFMFNTKLFKIFVIIGFFSIIVSLGFYLYKKNKNPVVSTVVSQVNNPEPFRDLVKEALEGNVLLQQVRDALLVKEYAKAIVLSKQVLTVSNNTLERSVAESSIAQAQLQLYEYKNGATTYYSIFNNQEYPKTTRASALNNILQRYRGTFDKELLKPVLPNYASLSSEEIYDTLYTMIYSVYPTGISSAWVGRMELSKINKYNTSTAQDIYNEFLEKIDKDITFQSQGIASAYIVPNTYMAKARFMNFVYTKFGLSSIEEISVTYEKAANLASARSDFITQQFALLGYVDFLGRHNDIKKAEEVFKLFSSQKIEDMVIQNFKQGDVKATWPGLAYLYTKSKVIKDFVDKNIPQQKN